MGNLTALAYVFTRGDPLRFSESRMVGAYLGLTPGRRQSSDQDQPTGMATDELARIVATVAKVDHESDDALASRYLVRTWRNKHCKRYDPPGDDRGDGRASEALFWLQFDLTFPIRRLSFVHHQIDGWLAFLDGAALGDSQSRKLDKSLRHLELSDQQSI